MRSEITASRYHDISCGHRVAGHESKCAALHGHNYRIHFECTAPTLDDLGRVIDFSAIKDRLCNWLESSWDHRFLAWEQDPIMSTIHAAVTDNFESEESTEMVLSSIVWTPFNPTAENMAQYLLEVIGPAQLLGTGVSLRSVVVEETRKCSARAEITAP